MTDPDRQELRRWGAEELMGWKLVRSARGIRGLKHLRHWIDGSDACMTVERDWQPDSPDAPASQMTMVIDKMALLGYDCYTNLYADDEGNSVQFYKNEKHQGFQSGFKRKDLRISTLLAAREAWEGSYSI